MKKLVHTKSSSLGGEKTPTKASFMQILKEDQQGRKNTLF